MTPKISFRNVTKTFPVKAGEFTALAGLSLDIADEEFVTVVGPSGCGKTTLLGMAAGLEEPTTGDVLVDGEPVTGPGPERGVIFQQYALFPWLTVRKNVEFGLKLTELPAAARRARVEHAIELVGLSDFADALPKTLSGGMKQRCAIARAYAVDPAVLLMDEPFGALDALTRAGAQRFLTQVWEQHRRTIVFVTHDIDEAIYLGDTVFVMSPRPGRIKDIVQIDLSRPRSLDDLATTRFGELKHRILAQIFADVDAEPAGRTAHS
jgi:NitT/TauT family transport system ATP-binding protein